MLEIYEAYGDVRSMMQLVQDLVTHAAQQANGELTVQVGDKTIDLTPPWRTVPYADLIREAAGDDYFDLSLDEQKARAESLGASIDPAWGEVEVTQEIFEKKIEGTLINPTFVTRLPVGLVPLAKACQDDPALVDVFELVIDGKEIAPAYSELNDPVEQRRRFEEQAGDDAEKMDEDFLAALEHGMPPAGGMGIGIDRLVMVLTGSESIRDVILFPQLKPKA
jgi:lysyl-tRNA synthetase class 2